MDKRILVAVAAVCLALLVVAQAAIFVYADGQAWWPWNGLWMVIIGVLVLTVVWVAGQRRDQAAVRSRAKHHDGRDVERR